MRRKSKKTKEETKESSSERRSKRSSTRRKRAYDDEEGGSGVEEERTTEEEMNPTKAKDRGGRRYATRGRRQKAEESEDEVSQGEEEQVDEEEENSNNLTVVAEPVNKEKEVSEDCKGLKSAVAISDKSIVSEGSDGASARKSDKPVWGMKSNKDSEEDKGGIAEETPAQGEGDEGEEEGSRSHSRKRKLKLSRECLQENREAIPKIRLRLSRNRSGGYETEKLEAERIETIRAEEETRVKVIKVKTLFEGKEPIESEEVISKEKRDRVTSKEEAEDIVSKEEAEEVVSKEQPEEIDCKEQPKEVVSEEQSEEVVSKEKPEEVVSEEQPEEVISEDQPEEVVSEEQPEEVISEDQPEEVVSKDQSKEGISEHQSEEVDSKEQSKEVISEDQPEVTSEDQPEVISEEQPEVIREEESEVISKEEPEEVVSKEEPEEIVCKEQTEEVCREETEEVEKKIESPETEPEETEVVCKEQAKEVESKVESPEVKKEEAKQEADEVISKVEEVSEEKQEEEGQQESPKEETPPSVSEITGEKLEAVLMEEKEQRTEPEETNIGEVEKDVEKAESPASSAEKEKEEEMEEKSEEQEEVEPEKQVEAPKETGESEEEREEETQEKQVSEAGEVSDQPMVEENKEAVESRASDSEKPKEDEKEASDAEEVKGEPEKMVEESKDVEVREAEVIKEIVQDVNESGDCRKGDEAGECNEDKQPNEGMSEVKQVLKEKEQECKSGGGERAGRISRTKVKQEDDAGEELQIQKRRRRRRSRSRESSGSEHRRLSTTSTSETPQPKRVTLKRPRLVRSTSSVSTKDATIEEEIVPKEEPVSEVEEPKEEKEEAEIPAEENTQQEESKPTEQSTDVDEGSKRRRRKWGQQKSQVGPSQSKRAFISISTHSLKGLIPEVKPLPIHELRLSVEKEEVKDVCMEEEESCEASMEETIVRMIDTNGQNERTVWAQVVDDEMRTSVHPEAPRIPVLGIGDASVSAGPIRRISIVSDDATRLQRSPSPPRHPPTSVLFLSNLVRPFTVQQLKELLARTGTVVEDGFWIDRIKSMCLVQYETEEQARETRHALHGVRWPISNPKRLWVDFATKERLEEAKREGNVPPPPPASTGPSLTPPHPAPRDEFPRKTEPLRADGSGMVPIHPVHRGTPSSPGRQGHATIRQPGQIMGGGPVDETAPADSVAWQQRSRPRTDAPPIRPGANARDFKLSAPVREWDLDKVVQQSPPRVGLHGPNRGPVDERRRPDAAGQPSGRRDRMLPSPPPSMQEMQARKAKRKEAEAAAAAAAAAEAPANLLDSLFRKTKATPSIYWLPLTAEQIKVKEEIRRQHLAEHERRMAEMKRAAEKDRGGRRRRRSSSPRRRSRRRSGEGSSVIHKKPSETVKGHKTTSASPKK